MSDQLRDAFAVLRALRERPQTVNEIADSTGVHWRKVYRLLEQMTEFGAPIKQGEREGKRGMPPATFAISAAALRDWLG